MLSDGGGVKQALLQPISGAKRVARLLGRGLPRLAGEVSVDSRPGSYSKIRKRPKLFAPAAEKAKGALNWATVSSPASAELYEEFKKFQPESSRGPAHQHAINLSRLDMDPRLIPVDLLRQCLNQVMREQGATIMGYGDKQGYLPLRHTIAQRMRLHGISIREEEILITNGSQSGIDLILKLMAHPEKKVVIESPTYAIALPLLKFYGMGLQAVPMREDGLDLDILRDTLQNNPISFLYTMPNFQNPTGVTTSQIHREKLMSICLASRTPVVEDGFEEEMKYFGKVPLPLKSMDGGQIVIYLGTFSKVLSPGMRIGWIAAEQGCIQRILALKRFSDLSSSTILQASLNQFCKRGYYEHHIKQMHRIFRKRMTCAVDALSRHVRRDEVIWQEPQGGYLIWLCLKQLRTEPSRVMQTFLDQGVIVSPGHYYYMEQPRDCYIRLSIAALNEEEIEAGIERLGKAITKIYQKGPE